MDVSQRFHRQRFRLASRSSACPPIIPPAPAARNSSSANLAAARVRQREHGESMREDARRERHHVVAGARRPRHVERAVRRRRPRRRSSLSAREVVVNQRIGMHDLHGRGELCDAGRRRSVESFVRREDQGRPQPLPLSEQAVVDHLVFRVCPTPTPVDRERASARYLARAFKSRGLF